MVYTIQQLSLLFLDTLFVTTQQYNFLVYFIMIIQSENCVQDFIFMKYSTFSPLTECLGSSLDRTTENSLSKVIKKSIIFLHLYLQNNVLNLTSKYTIFNHHIDNVESDYVCMYVYIIQNIIRKQTNQNTLLIKIKI